MSIISVIFIGIYTAKVCLDTTTLQLQQLNTVLQKIGMNNWEAFGNWIETEGIERFKEEIQSLNGKDYITATSLILEFFKPKLTRSAVSIDTRIHIESVIFE